MRRRRILSINVTSNPSAGWTANQIVQTFPWGSAPRYLLRDRDGIYGKHFRSRVQNLGIQEVIIARRSPWQTPYVERVIGRPLSRVSSELQASSSRLRIGLDSVCRMHSQT